MTTPKKRSGRSLRVGTMWSGGRTVFECLASGGRGFDCPGFDGGLEGGEEGFEEGAGTGADFDEECPPTPACAALRLRYLPPKARFAHWGDYPGTIDLYPARSCFARWGDYSRSAVRGPRSAKWGRRLALRLTGQGSTPIPLAPLGYFPLPGGSREFLVDESGQGFAEERAHLRGR